VGGIEQFGVPQPAKSTPVTVGTEHPLPKHPLVKADSRLGRDVFPPYLSPLIDVQLQLRHKVDVHGIVHRHREGQEFWPVINDIYGPDF
jgi:hypothetical protein